MVARLFSFLLASTKEERPRDARLRARPRAAPIEEGGAGGNGSRPGTVRLDVGPRGALLYLPDHLHATHGAAGAPLAVVLHGAGGRADDALALVRHAADHHGIAVLAVQSARSTWDAIGGALGPDVAAIDAALAQAFSAVAVDPTRIAVAGFSDGASYALALGVANGDLFTHTIAFSPGFVPPVAACGKTRVFASHGDADTVLPIDACSRRVVPALRVRGFDVHYVEFEGGHSVPEHIVEDAFAGFVGGGLTPRGASAAPAQ